MFLISALILIENICIAIYKSNLSDIQINRGEPVAVERPGLFASEFTGKNSNIERLRCPIIWFSSEVVKQFYGILLSLAINV